MKKLVEIVSLNDETDYISLDLNNDLNQLKLIPRRIAVAGGKQKHKSTS